MRSYKNLSEQSGIKSHEIRKDQIVIEFEDEGIGAYTYMLEDIGPDHFDELKRRAEDGVGLAAYINRNREVYDSGKPVNE